ncbi:MAG: hypothetical protein LBD41_06830 [Clostridiales Family XIII bacterium]|nr:hypothetical protein [Clostridiales Family XIII bacterium]
MHKVKKFFKQFADKMGWKVKMQQNLWDEYIKTCPIEVDLSDEDIMAEVRVVRYGKMLTSIFKKNSQLTVINIRLE